MTKNVFKIGAVVLLICMLGAVGVSSVAAHEGTTHAAFELEPEQYIWMNTDKPNWTYVSGISGEPIVLIKAKTTGVDGFQYLAAYNITLGGNLTEVPEFKNLTDFKLTNVLSTFSPESIAQNDWKVASTVTNGLTNLDQITSLKPIAELSLLKDASVGLNKLAEREKPYGILIKDTSELGLAKKNSVNGLELTDFEKDKSDDNSDEFVFFVRTNDPKIDSLNINDYVNGVEDSELVYIYAEHGNVNVETNHQNTLDLKFDDVDWTTDAANFTLASNSESINNEIQINGEVTNPWGQNLVTVNVNEEIGIDVTNRTEVQDTHRFTLNVTNWNRSKTETAIAPVSGAQPTGRDGTCWDFVTPLGINYTVGAGKMIGSGGTVLIDSETGVDLNNGWNSNVNIGTITVGTGLGGVTPTEWTAQNVRYFKANDGTTTENRFEINGVADGNPLSNIDANTKFIVTKNRIGNGADENDVLIVLSGLTKGDADMDNHVDIVDSSIVGIAAIRHANLGEDGVSELIDGTMENFIYADCNKQGGDGEIDVADVRAINRFLVNLDPWYAGEEVDPQYS